MTEIEIQHTETQNVPRRPIDALLHRPVLYWGSGALLLLALENCHLTHSPLPRPRWQRLRPQHPHPRITTSQAISLLRADLWASALSLQNKNGFAALDRRATKPLLIQNNLQSAVLYASG